MINDSVDDLDALLVDLAAAGVWIDSKRLNESYGRFAWIKDCDGNRVELWQPLET
ncbi:MAG: Glyoxalase/bleomycin resistance protein/dioxygenase [Myxococcaceae bacterium]|nr:Glyoxalase/bleomycin resistance protein/dioxygenase [Myxococcaceae bacterium]